MKKNSRFWAVAFISFYAFSSVGAQPAAEITVMEDDYVSPLISFGQVSTLKNRFTGWLNKHYSCLYGGRCTKQEKAEVLNQWKGWIKRLGWAAVIGLIYYYGRPKVEEAAERAKEFRKNIITMAHEAGQAMAKGALGLRPEDELNLKQQVSDLVSQAALTLLKPEAPTGRAPITKMTPAQIKARIEEIARDTAIAAVKGAVGMAEEDSLTTPELIALVKRLIGEATNAALGQAEVQAQLGPIKMTVFRGESISGESEGAQVEVPQSRHRREASPPAQGLEGLFE